jgi:hypothetical protein
MAKVKIFKKDGSASPYFWSNRDSGDRTAMTVYKQTAEGVKRMTGVCYNAVTKRIRKD